MGKKETRRIKPSMLQTDKDCSAAIETIGGYSPVNSRYLLKALLTARDELSRAQEKEAQASATAAAARQRAVSLEWEFHNLILGAKDQVVAQFGRDSEEAKAMGLKKKSEYKSRARRQPVRESTTNAISRSRNSENRKTIH